MKKPNWFKKHLIDTTGLSLVATPIFALIETTKGEMSFLESIYSRAGATATGYLGKAFIYSRGRDIIRNFFNINDKTSEVVQTTTDAIYSGLFNFALGMGIYTFTTNKDLGSLVESSFWAGLVGTGVGPIGGYVIDVFRDLTGIQKCERDLYPKKIKNLGNREKKIALGFVSAGLVGLTTIVYGLTSQ